MLLLPVPYLVFCCFFLGISSFLCLPPMKQSSKRGCRGSASCLFLMLCPLLWTLHLQHHAELERPLYRRSLSFLVPVFFELYGSIPFLFISILSRDYIFFTFFPGSSQPSRKSFTLLSATGNSPSGSCFFIFCFHKPSQSVKLLSFFKI